MGFGYKEFDRFNSQPRKGADLRYSVIRLRMLCFNSQPRKGADQELGIEIPEDKSFNSQPRKGADLHAVSATGLY